MKIIFWISLFTIFYTYLGYGLIVYFILNIRRTFKGTPAKLIYKTEDLPTCTLVIAAYNEEGLMLEKIQNTLSLTYPKGKLDLIFITDGSTDRSPELLARYPQIKLMHQKERLGKVAAIHRAVEQVQTEIIIFTDANTTLNRDALINIARHYADKQVGAVAGEKRVQIEVQSDAGTAGEGIYWKYESQLKKWDSELYSVVGAAGELFSVRRELVEPVPEDTILDDFMISMLIAAGGYRIVYEPEAYAIEAASENVNEELKRKIRIAAGGIQSIIRLRGLLNILNHGILSFQYVSHRVLRWTITPFLLIVVFILNAAITFLTGELLYSLLFAVQLCFYLSALSGFIFEKKQVRIKAFFIPYYFCIMNYAIIIGIIRYMSKGQSAIWEKAKRKN